MKYQVRVKIDKNKQRYLFGKLKDALGSRICVSNFFGLKENTYKNYSSARTRYIPKKIVLKLCYELNEDIPVILDQKTLREIRQETIKKTYPVLKEKYGKNWVKILAKRGHKVTEGKYGKGWRKIIAEKGWDTSRKKYGENFRKLIWCKAVVNLERKYGKNWGKVISEKSIEVFKKKYGKNWGKILMKNARISLVRKYGKNWAKILSRKGEKSLRKKYGKNYRQKLYLMADLLGKHPLTVHEKDICKYLERNNISFETHCVKNNREYDIIIPNLRNPKIVIESSNLNPTTHNQRLKILQLLEQKKNFPNSINLAIFRDSGKHQNFSYFTYNFLLDQGILVFWNKDLKKVIKMIRNYLDGFNEDLLEHRYNDFNEELSKLRSFYGALSNKVKINSDEIKLNNLLNKIRARPRGPYILRTEYGNSLTLDNFEISNNIKIAYEITSTNKYFALSSLAGKVAYLKTLYNDLKVIVILTNVDKLNQNKISDSFFHYADAIVLKNQFNEQGLIFARSSILSKLET